MRTTHKVARKGRLGMWLFRLDQLVENKREKEKESIHGSMFVQIWLMSAHTTLYLRHGDQRDFQWRSVGSRTRMGFRLTRPSALFYIACLSPLTPHADSKLFTFPEHLSKLSFLRIFARIRVYSPSMSNVSLILRRSAATRSTRFFFITFTKIFDYGVK